MKSTIYMGLQELMGRQGNAVPPEPPKLPWWQIVLNRVFPDRDEALRAENAALRSRLLTMTQVAEDSGRIGLQLLAENEALRDKAAFGTADLEVAQRIRQHEIFLEKENVELRKKLKTLEDRYGKLTEDVNKWIVEYNPEKGARK